MVEAAKDGPPQVHPKKDVTFVGSAEAAPKISVDIEVLPETRFERPQLTGDVSQIASIGGIIAVLHTADGWSGVTVFDETQKRVDLPLDPRVRDLFSADQSSIRTARSNYTYPTAEQILSKTGYPVPIAKRVSEKFDEWAINNKLTSSENNVHFNSEVGNKQNQPLPTFTNWDVHIGEKGFVFTIAEKYFILDPDKIRKGDTGDTVKSNYLAVKPNEQVNIPALTFSDGIELRATKGLIELHKEGRVVGSYSGYNVARDPTAQDTIYFLNTGHVYSLDVTKGAKRQMVPIQEQQIDIKNPEELVIDPNGNFLVIRSGHTATIVDKLSGDVMNTFSDVKGALHVDDQGDILFIDTQNRIREAQTNFKAIPPGGTHAASGAREAKLKAMEDRFRGLRLDDPNALSKHAPTTETRVEKTLRETVKKEIEAKLGTNPTEEQLEDVLDRMTQFREDPQNKGFEHVFDEFSNGVKTKLTGIRVGRLKEGLGAFEKQLKEVKSVGDSINLEDSYLDLVALRQKIDITDITARHELEAQMKTIEGKKNTIVAKYQGELVGAIRTELPNLKALIDEAGSLEELSAFDSTAQSRRIDLMIANVKDVNERRGLRDEFRGLKTTRRQALESGQRQAEFEKNVRYAEILDDVHAELDNLSSEISQLSDPKEIDRFKRGAAVTALKGRLLMLPQELRTAEEQKMEILLSARRLDIKRFKDLGVDMTSETVKLGSVDFPRFKEQKPILQPKLEPAPGNPSVAKLRFVNQFGKSWRPRDKDLTVPNDLSDKKTLAATEAYRGQADEYFRSLKRNVPEFSQFWRITPFLEEKMGEIAETLKMQMDYHRGILILQGEAGTGKNVIADMFGNLTNREIVTIACNENTTKEDMQFEFQYDPKRGTYKLPSKLVEALQTPGSVVVFDEINALKPGIAKLLNSLFDYRRRIYLSEGGTTREIIVDPSVILMGTMNPQNYAGVNRLSPEVKSRARIIDLPYPPFEEKRNGATYYRPDEAYMVGAYVDGLADLNRQEFLEVWDAVINRSRGAATGTAQTLLSANPDFETKVRNLYDVVRVANKLRGMYEAYQTGESIEPMDFPTSLREVSDVVMESNYRKDILDSVMRVIPPKIDDRRQRKLVEESIKAELVKP